MKDLTLFNLGKDKYGIWRDEAASVKDFQTIHWLPPVPKHIAGLSLLDGLSVTLFDLSACVGLPPIIRKKASYPVLMAEHVKKIAGFMVDFTIGHFAIPPRDVYPLPEFLQTPIIDTCAMYDSEPIPIINLSKLYKSVLEAEFKPPLAKHCISGFQAEYNFSVKTVRIFECGGESFAVSGACIKKRGLKPGLISKPAQLPQYVSGITFHDENLVTLIHMPRRMHLPEKKTPELMLVADIGEQTFGLLVDSDNDEWHDKYFTVKPLPPIVQGDWMQDAVLHGKEIIPIIEPVGLISNQSDGFNRTPLPQRYTPSSQFKSIFGKEDVQVFEFSLLGARHAFPHYEVKDQFQVKPYRRLPDVMSIVAGVTEYAGELLPVLDLAACFGRDSMVTPDWQMLLVKNGDFRALVLIEAIFGERILPVKMHRELPFEEPHVLVYGCYPDEAMVRLVLNVEALAVHFDKTLFKNFFTTLSKEIALEPMNIGFEPELVKAEIRALAEEGLEVLETAEPEEVEKPLRPERSTDIIAALSATKDDKEIEIQESAGTAPPDIEVAVAEEEEIIVIVDAVERQKTQEIVATELGASQAGILEEIGPQMKPKATVEKEEMEEIHEPVKLAETEELFKPEELPTSIAFIAAEEAEEAEEKREIKEIAEIAPLDIATADLVEIPATEEKTDFQETQKIAETKAEMTHVVDSEDLRLEPKPEETGLSDPVEEPENPDEPEISEKQIVDTELEVSQTGVSEEIVQEPEPEATEVGGPAQEAKEQIEEGIEPVEIVEAEGPFEPEGSPTSIAFIAAEEAEENREFKEAVEIALPDIAAAADIAEIYATEEKIDFQETQKIAETKAEGTHVVGSEEFGPEPEPDATKVGGPVEEPAKPAEPEISEKQTVETALEVSQTGVSEEIVPGPEPEETEAGGPAQKATEQVEEGIEPVEFAEAEELFEPEESPASIALIAAEEAEEKREIKEIAEIAPLDIATADLVEIPATEEKTDFQETQKIAETKAEVTHVAVSEEFGPEPEPDATVVGGPVEEPEKPAEPEISEKQTVETALEVSQTGVSEEIEPGPELEETEAGGPAQKATEQIEEGIEPVEFAEAEELFEPEESPASIAYIAAEEAEEKREIKEIAEVAPPDIATTDLVEIPATEEKTDFQETQKIAETQAEGTHAAGSKEFGPEPEPDATNVGGPVEEPAKPAEPEISEKQTIETALEVSQTEVSEEIAPRTAPEKTEQEEQVNEIIELTELVEVEKIIELTELVEIEELIEAEEAPDPTVHTSDKDTALPVAKSVSGNSETDARQKPQRRFAAAVFVAILLIGLLIITLYPSGLFETWMVDKENEKTVAPVTATQPSPAKPKTSLSPKSEKPPAVSTGPKLAEVQKESTETPAALAKPEPSPAKHLEPPTPKTAPTVPFGPEIAEVEKLNSGTQAALANTEPSLTKHLEPPTPKTAPAVPSGSEIAEVEEVNSGKPVAAEVHGLVPAIALKQTAPRMSSSESSDIAIHNVEKGDTLWNISKRYTGTGFNYPHVAKENEITNPDLIFIKQKVRVNKKYEINKNESVEVTH